jgi:hypothetical protein
MKTIALLIVIFLIMLIMATGSALVMNAVLSSADIAVDVEPMQLFSAILGTYPMLVFLFGMSLFFGAFMPTRRSALVLMFVFYLASYIANSVSGLVDSLAWMERISLFSYINTTATVFTEGQDLGNVTILLGLGAVFFALALWAFEGRNITVGQWIWERKQSPA